MVRVRGRQTSAEMKEERKQKLKDLAAKNQVVVVVVYSLYLKRKLLKLYSIE